MKCQDFQRLLRAGIHPLAKAKPCHGRAADSSWRGWHVKVDKGNSVLERHWGKARPGGEDSGFSCDSWHSTALTHSLQQGAGTGRIYYGNGGQTKPLMDGLAELQELKSEWHLGQGQTLQERDSKSARGVSHTGRGLESVWRKIK